MKKLLGLVLAGVLFSSAAFSAEETEYRSGRGFFVANRFFQNPSAINNLTGTRGFGTYRNATMLGGQGFGIVKNRILIGGEGYGIIYSTDASPTSTAYKASLVGGAGFFDIGFVAVETGGFSLYPYVGFGGGGLTLDLENQNAVSFEGVLDNPARSSSLQRGFLAVNFAVGADYLINVSPKANEEGGLAIGFRAGYLWSAAKFDWNSGSVAVTGGPNVSINGPYLGITIGGGGKKIRKKECED